jgi:hypothetical protein
VREGLGANVLRVVQCPGALLFLARKQTTYLSPYSLVAHSGRPSHSGASKWAGLLWSPEKKSH